MNDTTIIHIFKSDNNNIADINTQNYQTKATINKPNLQV